MKFIFITLFPDLIKRVTEFSIIKRAIENEIIDVECINPRDFTIDKHHMVDDVPYGGGVGMVLKPEPFVLAIKKAKTVLPKAKVIAMCPTGQIFKQSMVEKFAVKEKQDLIFVCGHYEGFDERIYQFVDEKISVGDYVLTGGELPALIILEAVARFVPGVLGKIESVEEESFSSSLLEYASYTRPNSFCDLEVPEVLSSGDHSKIDVWRKKNSFLKTIVNRPDLLGKYKFKKGDGKVFLSVVKELKGEKNG